MYVSVGSRNRLPQCPVDGDLLVRKEPDSSSINVLQKLPKYWAIFVIEPRPSIVSIMQTRRSVVETSRLALVTWPAGEVVVDAESRD